MKIRKIASLTAALPFLLTLLTSVVLYIVPQGRIAYWSDWYLWGLSKEQYSPVQSSPGQYTNIIGYQQTKQNFSKESLTLKKIAEKNQLSSMDIYKKIKAIPSTH